MEFTMATAVLALLLLAVFQTKKNIENIALVMVFTGIVVDFIRILL